MKKVKIIAIVGAVLFLVAACAPMTPSPTPQPPELSFSPRMTMFEEGKITFELGVNNDGNTPSSEIDDVNIRAVITDEQGKIRNQMTIVDLGAIPAGGRTAPLVYEAVYDEGSYVMSLTGEDLTSLTIPFEIREEDDIRMLAAPAEYINPHTEFTIDSHNLEE